MTGLDTIIEEIITEARGEAELILAEARSKAEEIKTQALEQAAGRSALIEADTDKRIIDLTARRKTGFALRRRQTELEARQTALSDTLSAARQALMNQRKDAYFAFVIKSAVAQAETGEGILFFNARDRERMPKNFQNLLNMALPEDKKLTVSETAARIDGGFILKYGDLEENCSFAAIFRQRHDEFIDLIRGLLFAG